MKNRKIRGIALGLAATSIMTISSGCGKRTPVSVPETASISSDNVDSVYSGHSYDPDTIIVYKGQEYKQAHDPSSEYVVNEYTGISYNNGLNTIDLYFIRIDDKIYLATKVVDINENNLISKFYAIDTGKFLGQTLDINWYARVTKDLEKIVPPSEEASIYEAYVDDDLKDKDYFNGEYGLGKNLCRESVISATSLFSEEKLTKEQIDKLLSDPLYTAILIEKYYYPCSVPHIREDYTFVPYRTDILWGFLTINRDVAFNGEVSTYYNKMYKFLIKDGDSTKTIYGYRASSNINDNGYNYVYDIESSCYLDLTKLNILEEEQVTYNNSVDGIREKLGLHYSIDDLKILSTLNLEGDEEFEDYYIIKRGNWLNGEIYSFDVVGEDSFFLIGNYDGSHFFISDVDNLLIKSTPYGEYNGLMEYLEECLKKNDLSEYIKDYYTEEELSMLLVKLRDKELDLRNPFSEGKKQYQRINIEDIIVIDTSKESGDSVLIEADRSYYILIPNSLLEDTDSINRYEVCNGTYASIHSEKKFIKVGSVYAVLKDDGELECIRPLDDVLREISLEDEIREDYAFIDLENLEYRINQKQNVLTRKQNS